MTGANNRFWVHFETLESRHRLAQSQHDKLSRKLDMERSEQAGNLMDVWASYCKVIAELDESTAEIEHFRSSFSADSLP